MSNKKQFFVILLGFIWLFIIKFFVFLAFLIRFLLDKIIGKPTEDGLLYIISISYGHLLTLLAFAAAAYVTSLIAPNLGFDNKKRVFIIFFTISFIMFYGMKLLPEETIQMIGRLLGKN